jgi:hypothetical protein
MKGTIRKLAVLITPGLSRDLVCDSCGNSFSCGASLSGCWCSEIKLSDDVRAGLKGRYRDCLCRDCLERIGTHASGVLDR